MNVLENPKRLGRKRDVVLAFRKRRVRIGPHRLETNDTRRRNGRQ
jgi:hypothetical protein